MRFIHLPFPFSAAAAVAGGGFSGDAGCLVVDEYA